jgi:riboflavin synthase
MFTGIIEELGTIKSIERSADSRRMIISVERIMADLKIGDSIAVNGACLTVGDLQSSAFSVYSSPETLSRTNLGKLTIGSKVNLERSLRLQDRLGGHLVLGHIDGIGYIKSRNRKEDSVLFEFTFPRELARYIVPKGSIAVDGISLTVSNLSPDFFEVSVIPYTLEVTTLGFKRVGDEVNLETDIIGKYVERLLGSYEEGISSRITSELLERTGFV